MRGMTSAVVLAAAGWVAWQNGAEGSGVITFPGLAALAPSLAGDLAAQGRATVGVLVAAGVLAAVLDAVGAWRERRGGE